MDDHVGQQLGNYRLSRLLGKGGFAEVYLGEHIYLKTPAAIKLLQTKVSNKADLEDFLKEAQTIAQLVHPHIVRVLEFGLDGETPFLVMDYAPNGTLRQRHPKGSQLPLMTIIPYVKQIAEALNYAHEEKFIHRDVKPENMLVGRRDAILLSDFGIALTAQSSRYQSTQEVIGTVAYMSPEQIQGKPRPASDQYSLGVVVYEWLSGDRPFHGSFTELCTQQMFAAPPPLREKLPTLPPTVEQVVMTALDKDPKRRFATVQAFANALEQASQIATEETLPATQLPQPADLKEAQRGAHQAVGPVGSAYAVLPPTEVATPSSKMSLPPTQLAAPTHLTSLPPDSLTVPASQSQASTDIVKDPLPGMAPSNSATVPDSSFTPHEGTVLAPYLRTEPAVKVSSSRKDHRTLSSGRIALLICLAFLVVAGGAGVFFTLRAKQVSNNALVTSTSQSSQVTQRAQMTPSSAPKFSNVVGAYSGSYQLSVFYEGNYQSSMTLDITRQTLTSFESQWDLEGQCVLGSTSYQLTAGNLTQSGFITFSFNYYTTNDVTLIFTGNAQSGRGWKGIIAGSDGSTSGTWSVS